MLRDPHRARVNPQVSEAIPAPVPGNDGQETTLERRTCLSCALRQQEGSDEGGYFVLGVVVVRFVVLRVVEERREMTKHCARNPAWTSVKGYLDHCAEGP